MIFFLLCNKKCLFLWKYHGIKVDVVKNGSVINKIDKNKIVLCPTKNMVVINDGNNEGTL